MTSQIFERFVMINDKHLTTSSFAIKQVALSRNKRIAIAHVTVSFDRLKISADILAL